MKWAEYYCNSVPLNPKCRCYDTGDEDDSIKPEVHKALSSDVDYRFMDISVKSNICKIIYFMDDVVLEKIVVQI